jgi:large subunit ribosomal protein L22
MSPRKARLVARHINGRSVPEARTVLAFTQRAAAREIEKVLRSAVANAEANHGLIGDKLIVSAAYVDEGPVMKRWRARARGRVARIKRPTCHITVKLVPGAEGAVAPPPPRPAPVIEEAPEATVEETAPIEAETEPEAEAETAEDQEAEAPAEPAAAEAPEQQPETEASAQQPKPKRRSRKKTEETEG